MARSATTGGGVHERDLVVEQQLRPWVELIGSFHFVIELKRLVVTKRPSRGGGVGG